MAGIRRRLLYTIFIVAVLLISYFVLFESLSSMNLNRSSSSSELTNLKFDNIGNNENSSILIRSRSSSTHQSDDEKARDKYSSYICIGDVHHKTETDRMISCHFTNICYSSSQRRWLYFNRNIATESAPRDIIYDNFDDLKDDFWDKFLLFRHNPPEYWMPYIRHQSAPPSSWKVKWVSDRTVFHYPFVTDNFGHCLGDNFYTIWHLLDLFGDYSPSNTLLLFHWNKLLEHPHSIDNIAKITPYITNQEPLALDPKNKEHPLFTYPQSDHALNSEFSGFDTFCFNDLYIGTTNMRLQRSGTKPYEWNRFISSRFLQHPIHSEVYNGWMVTKKQSILFLNKTMGDHRRYYANDITAVCSYIEELFGVDVDIMTDRDLVEMTLEDQINLMLRYTILISPCGSLAFLGVFQREGTAMITMDWWNEIANHSAHLESYLWEFETRKKTFYYYMTRQDVVKRIDDDLVKKKRISFHDVSLHWSDYIVRKKRLATYVHAALNWIEAYNEWTDTFKRPSKNWVDSSDELT